MINEVSFLRAVPKNRFDSFKDVFFCIEKYILTGKHLNLEIISYFHVVIISHVIFIKSFITKLI